MKKFFPLTFFLLIFLVGGCAPKVDLGPGYKIMSKNFLQALRWKDFQGAAIYMKPEHRQALLDSFKDSKDLHIVGAEYEYSRLNKKLGTAKSKLILEYYLLPSTRVQEWAWEIEWILIPADTKQRGAWQVQSASPAFPNLDEID